MVPPTEVKSQYDYTYCAYTIFDGFVSYCGEEATRTVYVSPLRPPFSYNNLCTSTILTNYIPVYVFVYAIQLLVIVLQVTVLASVKYTSLPKLLQRGLHGVFWPNHEWVSSRVEPRGILKATEIVSFDILNHLAVFLTFGISSPYLALILIISVCLKLYMWRVVIGRFTYVRSPPSIDCGQIAVDDGMCGSEGDSGLSTLSVACLPILDMLEDNIWPIVVSSSMFFAVICWDMAGDKVDWIGSLWAPVIVLLIPLFLWSYIGYSSRQYSSESSTGEIPEKFQSQNGRSLKPTMNPIQGTNYPVIDIEMRASQYK